MRYKAELKEAFKVSIPIMMGYSVLGFAFGLLLVSFHYPVCIAILMSVVIYAGALQFLAIGFLNTKLGFFDIFIASILVNFRQIFYGLSLLEKFKSAKFKNYLIFGLTDETYALLSSIEPKEEIDKKIYYLFLTLFNQIYWVSGSTLGALFGSFVDFNTKGLEFSLTALFVVLAIEQYKKHKKITLFLIGSVASILSFNIVSFDKMLITSILLSLIGLYFLRSRV